MADSTDTVVLIHGLWMTPLAWEHWVARYQERGFTVLTPGYPGIEPGTAGVAELREDASALDDVGVREVMDHIGAIIQDLRRDHFTCGEPGWEAVADFALDWASTRSPACWRMHPAST